MSRVGWDFEEEAEWDVAVNKKKISREVRKERKALEAEASGGAAVGSDEPEFNAEERRKMAAASFYGKQQQRAKKGKQSKHRGPPPDLDFEPAGWEGGAYGEQKSGKKKGKPKAAVPQYNTAEELYTALAEIISHVPPTARGSTTTLASLGDKLQTLTKSAWNKRYKPEFGSMSKFLAADARFVVNGDEVGLNEAAAKKKSGNKKSKSDAAGSSSSSGRQQSEEEEEEDDESESEEEDANHPASPRRSQKQRAQEDSESSGSVTFKSILLTVAAAAIAGYLWLDHIRPMLQKKK